MALILRQESAIGFVTKGSPLTNTEVDNNNVELYNLILGQVSAAGDTMTGKLTFATPTSSLASLNLPLGSTVTTPTNGDLWSTSSGIFYRTGGMTKQIAFTDTPVGTAANSDLLDGFDSAYFLNASNLNAGTVPVARLSGSYTINAATATALQTVRTIALSGDVNGSVNFDGTSNVTITTTIQPDSVALGTDTTGNYIALAAAGAGITVSGSGVENASIIIGHAATSTASSVTNTGYTFLRSVSIDQFGHVTGFGTALDITTELNTSLIASTNDAATFYPTFVNGTSGRLANLVDVNLSYNAATNVLSVGTLNASSQQINGTLFVDSGRNITAGNVTGVNGTFSGVVTAADVNSTSDANLKENVYTIPNALATVERMRGVMFNWKEDGRTASGVIAQEMQQTAEHIVGNSNGTLNVGYNQIIGYLIEAVKELSEEVKRLKAK